MKEIKIKSFKITDYKAPLDIDPAMNYKMGKYLDIKFEVRDCSGFRMKSEYIGTYSHKLKVKSGRPICKMTYDDLEEMAYQVIQKEFNKKL